MSFALTTWTAYNIGQKIRNVTGMRSQEQLTDQELFDRMNQYQAFTMPAELKNQIQNQFLKFKTTPGINVYSFPGTYITDSPGAYADGFPLIFYQDPDIFFQDWPQQYSVDSVAAGTGSQTTFTGATQGFPIIIGSFFITDGFQVLQDIGFSSLTTVIATGTGVSSYSGTLAAIPVSVGTFEISTTQETFVDNSTGTLTGSAGGTGTINYVSGVWTLNFAAVVASGVPIEATYSVVGLGVLSGNGSGTINYATGVFSATFSTAPASTLTVYDKYICYQGNRPQGVLFFENEFTFMPVPDQVYQIQMQGFVSPPQFSSWTDEPAQAEWGPCIAYGTSVEIFADNGDTDNYDRYYSLLKRYENVALGRTIQQYTQEQSVPRF